MVTILSLRHFLTLLTVLLALNGCASDRYSCDEEPCPRPFPITLPKIKAITITSASIDIRSEESKQRYPAPFSCDDFRVTQHDMEMFFKLAEEISNQDYMHTISWIHCQAIGEVHFADGSTARWSVMYSSGGVLVFPDGRRTYLFCTRCKKPFIPS